MGVRFICDGCGVLDPGPGWSPKSGAATMKVSNLGTSPALRNLERETFSGSLTSADWCNLCTQVAVAAVALRYQHKVDSGEAERRA